MNLLLVEDDSDIAASMTDVLSDAGYQVRWARDGAAGFEALQQGFAPVAIVLDVMMPRMNGHEFLQQLRATEPFAKIPVLVTSALHAPAPAADGFLRKPFSIDQLLAALQRLPKP